LLLQEKLPERTNLWASLPNFCLVILDRKGSRGCVVKKIKLTLGCIKFL
jgi:hypothetical protein